MKQNLLLQFSEPIREHNGANVFLVSKEASFANPVVTVNNIGDGGNELGMGSLREEIYAHIPNGETIGCVVRSDAPIVASISNWGGAVPLQPHTRARLQGYPTTVLTW